MLLMTSQCKNTNEKVLRSWVTLDKHCHAKTLLVDHVWASVGSFNWDYYSGRRNLEAVLTCFDSRFAKQLDAIHTKLTLGHIPIDESASNLSKDKNCENARKSSKYSFVEFLKRFIIYPNPIKPDFRVGFIRDLQWSTADHQAMQNLKRTNLPFCREFTYSDWLRWSRLHRLVARVSSWIYYLSGTHVFDNLKDINLRTK